MSAEQSFWRFTGHVEATTLFQGCSGVKRSQVLAQVEHSFRRRDENWRPDDPKALFEATFGGASKDMGGKSMENQ